MGSPSDGGFRPGGTLFLRCTIWRQPAEHHGAATRPHARVIVTGRLRQRSFETHDGDKRTVIEMDVDEVGPLRYAVVKPKVVATETQTRRPGGTANGDDDEPPF